MKKLIVLVIAIAMLFSIIAVPTSAIPAGCTAIDVTANVKFATVTQMYKNNLPIIRHDSQFVSAIMYDPANIKTPGTGIRDIELGGFNKEDYKDKVLYDQHYLDDILFSYPSVWGNNNGEETSKLTYKFTVAEAGTYEFVMVGCAQIKAENVGNDAKDRGFSYSVDGGQKYQVNISDTPLIFRDYDYIYSMEDAEKVVTEGTYDYYQMGYVYGIKVDLTAGDHTFEWYHLEYSGETVLNTGNGPRLNYAGFYYQKWLDDAALSAYEYPKAPETTPVVTTTPEVTTTVTPTTTPTPTTPATPEATTPAPGTTAAPQASGGCGSAISGMAVLLAFAGAAYIASKKHN